MAQTAYFDCFSGASGDMVLGALLDLGLPLDGLRAALGTLGIEYGEIAAERVLRAGVSATRFRAFADETVVAGSPVAHDHAHTTGHSHGPTRGPAGGASRASTQTGAPALSGPSRHDHHHSLSAIRAAIGRSGLSPAGKDRAVSLFDRLAEAESAIHDVPVDRIHLHEVGALDSIIDVVGTVHGMEWLGVDEVVVSPLNVGSGTVRCAHGEFPVPAPATARILAGAPIYAGAVRTELVTPTGALLMTGYATRFGPLPAMRLDRIGYGAGSKDFTQHPNVLRVLVGTTEGPPASDTIVVLECEIDDMNPQLFGPLMDRLYDSGALDVFYVPVQMKKSRPGTLVTVLATPERRAALASVLFVESTTIGVRYREMQRERLERELRTLDTPVGPIRFKVATRDGRILNAAPEFEDVARAAAVAGVPVKDVQALAITAWVEARAGQGEH
ncbi:MAG: nickel pincer cofactor biosynthesis protein LarC [Vicinamibacterales bacterium]